MYIDLKMSIIVWVWGKTHTFFLKKRNPWFYTYKKTWQKLCILKQTEEWGRILFLAGIRNLIMTWPYYIPLSMDDCLTTAAGWFLCTATEGLDCTPGTWMVTRFSSKFKISALPLLPRCDLLDEDEVSASEFNSRWGLSGWCCWWCCCCWCMSE